MLVNQKTLPPVYMYLLLYDMLHFCAPATLQCLPHPPCTLACSYHYTSEPLFMHFWPLPPPPRYMYISGCSRIVLDTHWLHFCFTKSYSQMGQLVASLSLLMNKAFIIGSQIRELVQHMPTELPTPFQ